MSLWTVVKLLVACLFVGLILAWLDRSPTSVLERAWAALVGAFHTLVRQAQGLLGSGSEIVGYVLTGAVVVVPIWLLFVLLGAIRRRR